MTVMTVVMVREEVGMVLQAVERDVVIDVWLGVYFQSSGDDSDWIIVVYMPYWPYIKTSLDSLS